MKTAAAMTIIASKGTTNSESNYGTERYIDQSYQLVVGGEAYRGFDAAKG
jgi:hypothetical protein